MFEWNRKADAICNVCHSQRGMGIIDACLSLLPPDCLRADGGLKGVTAACCGHDDSDYDHSKYVVTITGRVFRGIGAFRQYQKWLGTSEARMALACNPTRMGWTQAGVSRPPCLWCGIPVCECTCCTWDIEEGVTTVTRNW